jgi:hypothetical protein
MSSTDQARMRCADFFVVRCPTALRKALSLAADRNLCSASAYVRLAVLERLRAEGIDDPLLTKSESSG